MKIAVLLDTHNLLRPEIIEIIKKHLNDGINLKKSFYDINFTIKEE